MNMQADTVDQILTQWSAQRPELDTSTLGAVIRVMALNRRFAREAARALEPLGLELFEYDVLSALRRQGAPFALPATVLARETDLSTGAMTNRIDRLQQRGLVERKDDPSDRRSVIVRLTSAGRDAIDEAIHVRLEAARDGLRHLDDQELKQLVDLLRTLVLSADED